MGKPSNQPSRKGDDDCRTAWRSVNCFLDISRNLRAGWWGGLDEEGMYSYSRTPK